MVPMREKWVDDIKVIACILVALGHFFQSMISSAILPETMLYSWFNKTIYYFHVPLFFLCSGYLYQKKTRYSSWMDKILSKSLSLGVPYFVFSLCTWILKELFSGAVNETNEQLLETLLISPMSPYWYLYTLFFMFCIIPQLRTRSMAVAVAICSVFLKYLRIFGYVETGIYAINTVSEYSIWFVLGMLLCYWKIGNSGNSKRKFRLGAVLWGLFLVMSVAVIVKKMPWKLLNVVMGLWGCSALLLVIRNWQIGDFLRQFLDTAARFTMPVFLMHTIFAAGVRAVILKLGITSPMVHVVFGVTVSFIGPIIAARVMEHMKLDFLIYPDKYLIKQKGSKLWKRN